MTTTTIDEQARRLVAVASAAARTELRAARAGPRALGDLYLRVRQRLRELGGFARPEEVVGDLAITIYLAWLTEEDPPGPEVLVLLKAAVESALQQSRGDE